MEDSEAASVVSPPTPRTGMPFDVETELGRDLAAVDWDATGLGPWQQWPASLVNTVRLMTASRFAMWMGWGPDLIFFCNDSYRRDTLGAKYPWALGKPARTVWSEIWPDLEPRVDSVRDGGVATWDEGLQLFLERSGYVEETYHTFSYSPIAGDDGQVAGLLCVVSEDTARVIGERRIGLLRDLGAALAGAATQLEVGFVAQRQVATDPYDLPFALGYLYGGDGAAELHWASGVAAGSPAAPLTVGPGDDHAWTEVLFGTDGEAELIDLVAASDLPTGGWAEPPLRALSVPLRQAGEREPYGYLIVGLNRYRNLDDDYRGFVELVAGQLSAAIARARAFEQERQRVEQLAELDRAKTTFFTNISHELRTPLTLLLGPADDALNDRDHPLDAAQRHRLEVVQRNAERLLKLVNTLLDFSRLESGKVAATYEQLDLSRFTVELASMFESAYERSGLSLTIDCAPLPTRPFVDREMWSKIVLNLLSNALKATFTGGVTVRLVEQSDGGGALLEVSDTGVGIPEAEQEHLFERFHRVSGAELRTYEGSGIGLALVSELVRQHGGSVSVDSRLGVGSTFRVAIPYGRDHLADAQVDDRVVDDVPEVARYSTGYLAEALRWLETAATDASFGAHAGRPHILVVDDNADMRDYIRSLLLEDYLVDTAADGAAALERIRSVPPDLVLTDVMMPVVDGFGLLSAIRADPATVHIPVVMLSARSGDDATVEGLDAGADDYLAKPFSGRELLARVRANLELDRVRRLVTELERSQQLLDNAETLARIGSWEVDLRTEHMRVSAEFARILGLSAEQANHLSLRPTLSLADPTDQTAFDLAVERALADGTSVDLELHATRPNGERYLARVRAVVIRDETDAPAFVRGSTQDITEQRAAEIELAAAHAGREAAAREHAIATELQQSLLPPRNFEADQLEIAAFYRAGVEGTQVGGDWQDVIDLGDGRTALVIGDVMGRGVRAAAVMGQLRAAVRAYARLDLAPAELVRLLDDTVRDISEDTIVTCIYAVYDPDERSLVYANAGHLPPLISEPGKGTRRLTSGGPPLGAGRQGATHEKVPLTIGATLTLYTDGLVERRGSDIDSGIDRLAELVHELSEPVPALPAALADALLPDGPDDDVALLICRVTSRAKSGRHGSAAIAHAAEEGAAEDNSAEHDVAADERSLAGAREFVRQTLRDWGIDDEVSSDVQLSVSELATNAIHHAVPPITVRLVLEAEHVLLEVRDGSLEEPTMQLSEPDDVSGRGLLIVSSVADGWGIRPEASGKTVWCRFRRAASEELAG